MEHCLFEESSLQSAIKFSDVGIDLTSEMIDLLLQRRCQRKAQQILQHIFFESLELEIFSTFDPRGDESLVALQRRLAASFIPHDQPDHKDFSPLHEIFKENAKGIHIGLRYFSGEVWSAGLFRPFLHEDSHQHNVSPRRKFVDKEKVRALGRQLRTNFLDPGARVDVNLLADTRGPEALFELYKFER